jgi:hypothetical protein
MIGWAGGNAFGIFLSANKNVVAKRFHVDLPSRLYEGGKIGDVTSVTGGRGSA